MTKFQEAARDVAEIAKKINPYEEWDKATVFRLITAGQRLHQTMIAKPVANWKCGRIDEEESHTFTRKD